MAPISPIVSTNEIVTLVGGGQASVADLHKSLKIAPVCVAADGGAALALEAGTELSAVIGDFDSAEDAVLAQVPQRRLHRVTEQDSTDFEKALIRISAPLVVGVGFSGGRLDHQLAVFHAMAALPDRPCLLLGAEEIVCLAPPQLEIPTQAGDVVSLFPLDAVSGRSTGLEWPIDGLAFHPTRRIGTSNIATGPVRLTFDEPDMLLILPRRLMQPVAASLAAPDAARWPARALGYRDPQP